MGDKAEFEELVNYSQAIKDESKQQLLTHENYFREKYDIVTLTPYSYDLM